MNLINEKIGTWLLEPGHTKKTLAKELGFSVVTLNKKLAGDTEWSWGQVQTLSRILGCTMDELCETAVA